MARRACDVRHVQLPRKASTRLTSNQDLHFDILNPSSIHPRPTRDRQPAFVYGPSGIFAKLTLLETEWTILNTSPVPKAGCGGHKGKSQGKGSTGGNREYTDWQSGAKTPASNYTPCTRAAALGGEAMTPTETVTPELILQTALGFMSAKLLFVANEIGLFTALEGGSCLLDELAARMNVPKRTVRIVADAMVSLGFVEKQDARYRNSVVTSAFLSGSGRADFRPFLTFWNHISYLKWTKLEDSVRAGKGMAGRFEFANEREQEIFSKGVEAFSMASARGLPDVHDFSPYHRVLDLGGGTGSFLLALLGRYPSLHGTLFELPAAAAVARKVFEGNPVAKRISIAEGDFFVTPIPQGHDVTIIANVIHTLSSEHTVEMFTNLRRSVAAGARLLLIDLFTDPTKTQPAMAAMLAGEFLVMTGEGDVYSEQEVREWLSATGWRPLVCTPLNGPTSLMVAEAAE